MKKIGLWALSVACGVLAISGLCILPSSWGMLFFAIPAVLFNPLFRNFAVKRNIKFGKSIIATAVVLPIITTGIAASTSPVTPTAKSATTSSAVISKAASFASAVPSVSSAAPVSSASASSQAADTVPTVSSGAKLKIHYIDVGQGDSEFIELPNGQTMLIDAGIPEQGPTVVSYIKSLGRSKIDYLIATHPHADHIGGMTDVIDSFTIGQMYMPRTSSADTPTTKVYENLLAAIRSKNIPVHTAKAGVNIISSGKLTANLIAPCGTDYHDLNQYSAAMMLQYGNNKFLFMGDAGNVSEDQITADVSADVLKVGHHGSRTATGQEFLNKVHPKYAVIEVGKGNSYGHPTAQTLNRLQAIGATIYRTDQDGTIIFTSDAKTITIDKKSSSVKQQAPPATTKKSSSTVTKKSTAVIAPATNDRSETVYITDTGKKYHTASCRTLKKSKHAISLKDAKAKGYTACGICHPPE